MTEAPPPDLPSPWLPRRGILLHVGPPKTGTTAIQTAAAASRESLGHYGLLYPDCFAGTQHVHAASAVMGRTLAGKQGPEPAGRWQALLGEVADRPDRALISSELFADAQGEARDRIVAALGSDLRVLVTLRPLEAILTASWQQDLQGGRSQEFEPWLHERLDHTSGELSFWLRHAHDRLVARWADVLGPDRVLVLIVDPRRPDRVLRDLERLSGVPKGTLRLQHGNRSLTAAEARMLQDFAARLGEDIDRRIYQRLVRRGGFDALVRNRRAAPDDPRITAPPWAIERARALHRPMIDAIVARGVTVVGDLAVLLPDTPIDDTAAALPKQVPTEAGADLAAGIFRTAHRDLIAQQRRIDELKSQLADARRAAGPTPVGPGAGRLSRLLRRP